MKLKIIKFECPSCHSKIFKSFPKKCQGVVYCRVCGIMYEVKIDKFKEIKRRERETKVRQKA